ncbi:hypothetical protein Q5P01_013629 [Channa striata]|uniref:CW-type domain-containing protein n=1 Tax=Channa striata TaxID=64152 RepID=A0AA88MN99_CHASR|nr:hypothetical protein Q5P01_013629 [Channa striata]
MLILSILSLFWFYLCPKFLHTNSTSHTWPFSAIAELIDNAYDPDVSAKQFWIDKTVIKGEECLTFMDNGNGLDHETMHKMLSFGYSDKTPIKGVEPIGIYGNGFKSGSMRLGKDVIVFSKSKTISCVGMLSQTYLEKIMKDEHKASLQDILRYSPFTTQEELLTELNAISYPLCTENTGTRIIIWSLRRTSEETGEFDFETDRYDIRIPSDVYEAMNDSSKLPDRVTSYIPESVYSLRAYCSILYLKPRMQVIIRGQKVKTQLIAKSLASIRKDNYKPTFLANKQGVGVIGVIECNYLDPTHNKQSFLETDKYRKTMNNLATKLEDYWKEMHYSRSDNPNSTTPVEEIMKRPDQNWVQCDDCLRWRKLPDGIDTHRLPEKWFCSMNPDPQFRSCQVEEEPEDSDDDQHTYNKTYKAQERQNKKQQEMKRQKEEEQRKLEQQRLADLTKQTEALKRKHKKLKKQLFQKTVDSPSNSTTPESRLRTERLKGGTASPESSPLSSSIISQAACSPSRSSGLPVISNVCSLSAGPLRGKRTQSVTPQTTPKRPRVNGFNRSTSVTPSSANMSPQCSPSMPVDRSDDDTDDEIFILEDLCTAKPINPGFDLTKVKTEQQQSDTNVNLLLKCGDDAAVDVTLGTDAAGTRFSGSPAVGTSPSPAPPQEVATATTQTEIPKLKKEEEDQIWTDERVVNNTSNKDAQSVNQDERASQNEGSHLESNEAAGPFCADACDEKNSLSHNPGIIELQTQQDQLLDLMQATAQERDIFKEQVHKLTCQLQDMQNRVQCQVDVKKECSSQASQTEETPETQREDYKSLFEKAKKKIDELITEKENLVIETKPISGREEEKDSDEIALQVDCLLRELDQTKKEKDELRSQLDTLKEEKANLASQCEELTLSLQQQKENAQKENTRKQRATDSSVQTDSEQAEGTGNSGPNSSSSTYQSLIELRQNIGPLLIKYVPALDLGQVNYECNVIDEILEQVVQKQLESVSAAGQSDEPGNYE